MAQIYSRAVHIATGIPYLMSADTIDPDLQFDSPNPAFDIARPEVLTSPVVFASPHSGCRYPERFLKMSRLDNRAIRRSEDAFVDALFAEAPNFGAPLLRAHFPRAYVDANRESYELDQDMFAEPLPEWVNTKSSRVLAGLGTVAKVVAGGAEIYRNQLKFEEVHRRIKTFHRPYHEALDGLIQNALNKFGACLLIDCHSMPSSAMPHPSGAPSLPDIILGDCHGISCSQDIVQTTETTLRDLGLSVDRNKPYAGGFTTRHYANKYDNVQTLQIEINRALYMDEVLIRRHSGFDRTAERMRILISRLMDINEKILPFRSAAE